MQLTYGEGKIILSLYPTLLQQKRSKRLSKEKPQSREKPFSYANNSWFHHSHLVIWMMPHLLLIGAKVKQEIHYQFDQSLLNNCRTKNNPNQLWKLLHYICNACLQWAMISGHILCFKFSPSPFLGPLIPSSAARSEGWRLRETSSFSLKRIATDRA